MAAKVQPGPRKHPGLGTDGARDRGDGMGKAAKVSQLAGACRYVMLALLHHTVTGLTTLDPVAQKKGGTSSPRAVSQNPLDAADSPTAGGETAFESEN